MSIAHDARASLAEAARLHRQGRLDEAEAVYAALLARDDVDPVALVNGGALALARGDVAHAIERLERAVAASPANAAAHNNLGFALLRAERADAALAAFDSAIGLQRDYAQAHNNRGIALVHLSRRTEAIEAFARALELQPGFAAAAVNLGNQHRHLGNGIAATAAFRRALAIAPDNVEARIGLAFAQALIGELDGSAAALQRVVAEHPDSVLAWQNLGAVCSWAWRHADAEAAFRRALELNPADDYARAGLASTLLATGSYAEGLIELERRREGVLAGNGRFADRPAWDGAPLTGTLLLYAEQGLGDVVQFCRFIPMLRSRIGRLVLLLDGYWETLAPLLASLAGVDRIATRIDELAGETIAARASILSLPYLAGVRASTIPGEGYLTAPADRIDAWRARVAGLGACKVGLAWSVMARDEHAYVTLHKSVPPATLAALLDTPGAGFATLQPGAAGDPSVLGTIGKRIADVRPSIHDFGDTAALIAALDLVISADTAVAHVAGALGKPVWLLDRFNCCWRWRLAPRTSPWYRSMRIFRQSRFGDWSAPVAEATAALADFVRPYRGRSNP